MRKIIAFSDGEVYEFFRDEGGTPQDRSKKPTMTLYLSPLAKEGYIAQHKKEGYVITKI